ncbi:type II secretion system secretin GspD (plasmid) [Rhizobium sp. TH2]|uniref:type II secretion system secretin GspD n=1 Tax=Rhizobium sp. TH2 TaxID=2775403 RepID=UPI002157C5B5|nr:type II secretion system secretin GspD [Rhizobium sp. TH2]UVC12614.1 type II secretion system secretin GspD [Rhizobium sp. TH2]
MLKQSWVLIATLLVVNLLMSGCQGSGIDGKEDSTFIDGVFGDVKAREARKARDAGVFSTADRRSDSRSRSENYLPDASGITPVDSDDTATAGEYTLNFDNVDVKDVVRAVLNDALKVNYTINGDVSGPVTISSARPVSREALLKSLESSLAAFGFSLVKSGNGYRVTATDTSAGTIDNGRKVRAGFGVSIVPLRYLPASSVMDLLNGFVGQADGLRINASGNSIIVRGSGPQRTEVVEAIMSFDADFMQNQRVSIFRLVQARPEDVVPELERIFNVKGDNSLIQFRVVSRIRGIMAISKNPALIRRADTWVRRLDQQDSATGQNVVIYKVKYRKAEELAKVVAGLFGVGANTNTPAKPAPVPQLDQPGEDQNAGQDDAADKANAPAPVDRIASAFGDDAQTDSGLPNVVDLTSNAREASTLRISADASNNSVVIYGDGDHTEQVVATLKKLDSTPVQVAINVTIAEVRLTEDLKYGVQYFLKSKQLGLGKDNGSLSLIDRAGNSIRKQTPGLNFVGGADANPDVIISALNVLTDVEILSSPSLVVIENQTATLQVGDEVPITTQQSQSVENSLAPVVNQVQFRETGIILNVTPRISQTDAVTMDIVQEISSVASGANTLTPTISKRSIRTQISVNDQQTVVLGGLISANSQKSKSGVPLLMKLPLVGDMFANTAKTKGRNELIVLIRPVIIRDAQDAADVAESLRSQMSVINDRSTTKW